MKPFSLQLKELVDLHCEKFKASSPLFEMGRKNQINYYHAASYVINLEHLFFNNAEDILGAAKKYSSDPVLAKYFFEKWSEEKGHDAWARADWAKMSKDKNVLARPHILPEMIELTDYLKDTMLRSPYEYITYMFVAEYMTPVLGPIWMDILDKNLGITKGQVTALTNHIELDGGHAMEVGIFLDSLNLLTETHIGLLHFVDELFTKYTNFFSALAKAGELYGYKERKTNPFPVLT